MQSVQLDWGTGPEGQRKADLGNGTFLNPIVAGDHPDPTILKDGGEYYLTFSSFLSCPGIVIWHSRDLVNWAPIGPALLRPMGPVWAMDLIKHSDRYFIYLPANPTGRGWSIFVIWSDDIRGPWSDPVDLELEGCIDPGHVVGEDGKRYLFVNGIRKVRLTDDGLATDGVLEHAYAPWQYPKDWVVEMFAPEGPKLTRHGDWFYLVTAVGGTSGPPTSHMVIAARSRSVHGPWQHCPSNPLVRTTSATEPWWSRGHATLVEGPAGDWWLVYHGYENGFRTLGRQTLLEPIEWTADGWFRTLGSDLSKPLPMPLANAGRPSPVGLALSDDFTSNRIGQQWSFHDAQPADLKRATYGDGGLLLEGKGVSPVDGCPLTCTVGEHAYEAELFFDVRGEVEGGLLLFYNSRMFAGIGFSPTAMVTYNYGERHSWMDVAMVTRAVSIRVRNDHHIVTWGYSHDGVTWVQHPWQMEVSGMHHNVLGGFLSLKLAVYAVGKGSLLLRHFSYRAIRG
jgi:xylan 1,4-beta-xylosidase